METLKVLHETCNGDLKHLYNRKGIRCGDIVDLEVFQCQKCCQLVEHVVTEDVTGVDLSILS